MKQLMPRLPSARSVDGDDQRDVGVLARGDELLHAVEDVSAIAALGAGADFACVGAALRLGQTEGAQHLAARHRPQIFLLLLRRAVFDQRHAADRVVPAHDGGNRAVAGRDLLQRQRVRHVIGAGAVPFRRHRHAHEAELAQFAQRRAREHRLAFPFGRIGRQHALREVARGLANVFLLFGQQHASYSAAWRRAASRAFKSSRATISFCTSVAPS